MRAPEMALLPPLPGLDDEAELASMVSTMSARKACVLSGSVIRYHRMPAPTVRAMAARTATTQVKRARFAFTIRLSYESCS